MDQIKREKFVSVFREESATINTRSFFETTFGFIPHIIYEGSKPTVHSLLRQNKGIFVSLRFEAALLEDPRIVMVPIEDEQFQTTVGLSWLKSNKWLKSNNKNAQCQYFIQFAKKYFAEQSIEIIEDTRKTE